MIAFFSSWVKGIGITIIIVSIIEMILPDNKTKKYIQMLLGIFVLFNIIAPLVQNTDKIKIDESIFEKYASVETSSSDIGDFSQGMAKIYKEELEKDIKIKLEEKGYIVSKCNINAKITDVNKYEILKIMIDVDKTENIENKVVTEIEKIKKVEIKNDTENKETKKKISEGDIQKIKNFLTEEYGVDEKCLEIN